MQVAIAADSLLPRDASVNTLYFSHSAGLAVGAADYQTLALDLANVYKTTWLNGQTEFQVQVKAYEANALLTAGGETGPPEAIATVNTGQSGGAGTPREVAICLSYYAGENQPGKRGRIYLPAYTNLMGGTTGRPSTAQMERARDMALGFSNLGGANVDWSLYSPKALTAVPITNAWVDNEWDTQRSRGLRATNRITAIIDE
jgi:hypothetical protein